MKKLAIVGTNPRTRDQAPFDNEEFEIWVFNEAPQFEWCKRWDAVFQMHKPEVYRNKQNHTRSDHWDWLQQKRGKIVWMQDQDPDVPDCQRYPIDEIILNVPGASLKWFDLSASYALALALYLGYKDIEIYGLDLVSNTEYSYQLRNWNFWVGVAYGTGVNIQLKCSSNDFGNGKLYGFDGEIQLDKLYFENRISELEKGWKKADLDLRKGRDRINEAILEHKFDKVPVMVTQCQDLAVVAGEISGALAEAQYYASQNGLISRQEFEKRSAMSQKNGDGFRILMYHASGKCEYVWNVWKQIGNSEALQQMRAFIGERLKHAFDMGGQSGIFSENIRYIEEYDSSVIAAGGTKAMAAITAKK